MRVLVATHISEPVGGITINYRTLLASSYSQLLDVRVVETSKGSLPFGERGGLNFVNWMNAMVNIWGFGVALLRERPRVVHIGSAYGASFAKHSMMALLARWLGFIVIMQLHCSLERLIPSQETLWKRYVIFVFKHINGIVTLSREWDALLKFLPNAQICYVPNAIDVHPYIKLVRPRTDQNGIVSVLFLGHIGREKGCFDLLLAVEQLRQLTNAPFCLHFVGETLYPGEKDQLQAEIETRKLQAWVQVYAPEYNEKKIARFGMSDIFVLPSYHEGMPMSVIEAMAAGLPVVATKVGGIPDQVIPEQTGILAELGDFQALVNGLLRLIENADERLKMGEAGRQRAMELYDIEVKAKSLVKFYQQLVKEQ